MKNNSKRLIAITGAISLYVTMFVNSFYHKDIQPSEEVVNAVMWVVIAAIGGNTAAYFSNKKGEPESSPEKPNIN